MEKKTKVLVFSHSPHFYGAEQSLLLLLQSMDRNKYESVVVLPKAFDENNNYFAKKLQEAEIRLLFAPFFGYWINPGDESTRLRGFLTGCANAKMAADLIITEQPDIVYTNTIVTISSAIAARMLGVPHIYHVREILKDHPLKAPVSIAAAFKIIETLSDGIVVNSRATAEQFDGIATSAKVRVIYNAVDINAFDQVERKGKLRAELGLEEKTAIIAIIGAVHAHKNHLEVVRAFANLYQRGFDARLLIVGSAHGDYSNKVRALVKELKLEDAVIFLPFRYDIPEIIDDLDVLVVASLGEPFGRTTIEAMAAKKPVVATCAGASPEIVVDGETGFLVPLHDPGTMADKIVTILSNPELAKRMGEAGRKRVEEIFEPRKYASDIEAVFSGLVRDNHTRQGAPGQQIAKEMLQALGSEESHQLAMKVLEHYEELGKYVNILSGGDALLDELIQTCNRDRVKLEAELLRLKKSYSWKLTKPLRDIVRFARKKK